MDASQILNQNLAPMLDAIRSYGQQLSREREIAEQRKYQADLRREERTYQEGRIAEQRAYEESMRLKQRGEKVDDERLSRRRDLSRKISRVFPDDDTQGMSDAQLEKRAIEAEQKISRDETLAKSESELRADGVRMGIANAEKMEISELQKQVIEKKNQQIIDTEQNRLKAAEAFQGQRLGTPEGQNAVEAYKRLAREKADTVRSLMTAGEDQEPPPVDPSLIGQRFLQLLQQGDMDTPIEQIKMGKRLYEAITDPRNRDLNARVLQPILAGQKPAASAIASIPNINPAEMVYLSQLEALAIRDITAQNPKMIQALAAQGRNNVYLQKMAIGEKLREIDSAMKQLTVGFPALSKIPSIDMEFLMSPGVKPAPGTEKPGIPTLPAVSPKGAMMTPAVPAGPEPISGVSVSATPPAAMSAAWSGQGGVRPSVAPGGMGQAGAVDHVPDVLGPPGPRDAFIQEGRRLGAMEGRGGTSTYGMQSTLTTPFYENVASILGIQPKQIGSSIFEKMPRSIVKDNFPTEQFDALPDDVKNRIYLDALRASSEATRTPRPYSFMGRSAYETLPFFDWRINRD